MPPAATARSERLPIRLVASRRLRPVGVHPVRQVSGSREFAFEDAEHQVIGEDRIKLLIIDNALVLAGRLDDEWNAVIRPAIVMRGLAPPMVRTDDDPGVVPCAGLLHGVPKRS